MAERERIDMTAEEIDAFLRAKDRLFLGLLTAGGAPTGATAGYAYADGALYFAIGDTAPELALLRADNRVCAIVEQVPSYFEIKAVTLHGRAEEVTEPAARARWIASLGPTASGGAAIFRLPLAGVVSF